MKKRKAPKPKREKIPLPDGFSIGDLIHYYDGGWRAGYLMSTRAAGKEVGIKPIVGYKHATAKNLLWIPIGDIKPIKGKDDGPREVHTKVRGRNRRVQVLQ